MKTDFETVKRQLAAAERSLAQASGRAVEPMRKARDRLRELFEQHPDNPIAGSEAKEVELRKTRIGKLIEALSTPDPAFQAVPNKIRQDSVDAIKEVLVELAMVKVALEKAQRGQAPGSGERLTRPAPSG